MGGVATALCSQKLSSQRRNPALLWWQERKEVLFARILHIASYRVLQNGTGQLE